MSRELSSLGWDIVLYMQKLKFEPQSSYLSTLRVEFLATRLIDQKKTN
jgi:hypothetical protein